MYSDIKCPYCGHEQDINHDDGYGYAEDETFEQECHQCEKIFAYTTEITFYHTAHKAPCMNGQPCNWKFRVAHPVDCSEYFCTYCDNTRKPTDEEWKHIETKHGKREYFKPEPIKEQSC